jgi:hypothetical protein
MCYVRYKQDIITKHKVELVGWPTSIRFANPSDIGTVDDIQKLRKALKAGECKWIMQSWGQQAAYAEMLAGKVAAGEQVVKKRKERSDKGKMQVKDGKKAVVGKSGKGSRQHGGGKVRGPGVSEDDDNNNNNNDEEPRQPPKKKRKCVTAAKARVEKKLPPALKSKKFIFDSDDDDDKSA